MFAGFPTKIRFRRTRQTRRADFAGMLYFSSREQLEFKLFVREKTKARNVFEKRAQTIIQNTPNI